MKLPKSVNVCGYQYSIKTVKPSELPDGVIGLCNGTKKTILLSKEMKGELLVRTVLHEIRHAYQFESGSSQILTGQAMEIDAEGFAALVYSIFDVKFKARKRAA